jgi:hypothetical protein
MFALFALSLRVIFVAAWRRQVSALLGDLMLNGLEGSVPVCRLSRSAAELVEHGREIVPTFDSQAP